MNELLEVKTITASGQIKSVPGRLKLYGIVYGTANAKLTLYDGTGPSGKKIGVVSATQYITTEECSLIPDSVPFSALYGELTGAGAEAVIYYI